MAYLDSLNLPPTPVRINNSYSELNPFTCKILICLTIVLFPDSPAPEKEEKNA